MELKLFLYNGFDKFFKRINRTFMELKQRK